MSWAKKRARISFGPRLEGVWVRPLFSPDGAWQNLVDAHTRQLLEATPLGRASWANLAALVTQNLGTLCNVCTVLCFLVDFSLPVFSVFLVHFSYCFELLINIQKLFAITKVFQNYKMCQKFLKRIVFTKNVNKF